MVELPFYSNTLAAPPGGGTQHEMKMKGPRHVDTQRTMTDEQRKSVALEYLKAYDNKGVTSNGGSILDLFADDAQAFYPKTTPLRRGRGGTVNLPENPLTRSERHGRHSHCFQLTFNFPS